MTTARGTGRPRRRSKTSGARGKKEGAPRTGLSLAEVRVSVSQLQAASEHLVERLWGDARTLVRQRRRAVEGLLNEARRVQGDVQRLTTRALRDLEARRADLGARAESFARAVVQRLKVASRDDLAQLEQRLATLERRLDTLARRSASGGSLAAAGS